MSNPIQRYRSYTNTSTKLICFTLGRLCGGAHEISGIKALRPQFFSVGGWGWGSGWVGGGVVRLSFESNSNSQKLSLWCKKIIVDLMKDLKYEHQSIFPLFGRVKLNFRDRYEKPNTYSKNSSHCQVFFSQDS